MSRQLSFTKFENELRPDFRQKMSSAESTEDVKKFFVYTVINLMKKVFADDFKLEYDDIAFAPTKAPYYKLNNQITEKDQFKSIWEKSDLPQVMKRFAESAANRFNHLVKNPDKTESKIRM
ncbi:MAG: hypothetical protein ACQES8_04615 [Thermodesulfobacteriota bacterium]